MKWKWAKPTNRHTALGHVLFLLPPEARDKVLTIMCVHATAALPNPLGQISNETSPSSSLPECEENNKIETTCLAEVKFRPQWYIISGVFLRWSFSFIDVSVLARILEGFVSGVYLHHVGCNIYSRRNLLSILKTQMGRWLHSNTDT